MSDSNENTATEGTKEAKAVKVIEGMAQRRFFDTTEDAANYLAACADSFTDFNDQPIAARGLSVDENGNAVFDSELYSDDMRVMIAVLTNKGEKGADGKRAPSTVKAIVITPAPKLETILANADARGWLDKIVNTELNHIAVRQLRNAAEIDTVADQMPASLAEYMASGRDSTGGIIDAFNELYKELNELFKKASKAWSKRRLTKPEIKNALQSRAFALDSFAELEDRGEGKESLFDMFLKLGIDAAKNQGKDPTIFERWLETRANKVIDTDDSDEDEDDDIDDFDALAAMVAAKSDESSEEEAPAEGA